MLANEGYVIVNINYKLAPSAKYPTQLTQVGEAYSYIDNSDDYPFIDKDQIYFGGDSAGAHIVAQFITIQTNPDYVMLLNESKETKDIKKIVDKEITGAILFAGPYDFKELSNLVKKRVVRDENQLLSSIVSFVAKRIGFGYLGTMNWKNNDKFDGLNVVDYVNNNFPSTFITDGRIISFEAHSKKLEQKLSEYNVGVHSVYYDYDLMHEYQMNLGTISDDNNNYAQLTFNELITFLNAS